MLIHTLYSEDNKRKKTAKGCNVTIFGKVENVHFYKRFA